MLVQAIHIYFLVRNVFG